MSFTYLSTAYWIPTANKTAGTPLSGSYQVAPQVGDLMVVFVVCDSVSGGTAIGTGAVTDSNGNTFTQIIEYDPNSAAGLAAGALFYSVVTTTPGTITFTPSSSSAAKHAYGVSFRPLGTVSVVASSAASNSGNGTAVTVSNGGTLQADDLVIGFMFIEGAYANLSPASDSDTLNGDWSLVHGYGGTSGGGGTSNVGGMIQHKIVNAAGTQTYDGTLGASLDWGAQIVAFRDTYTPVFIATQPIQVTAEAIHRASRW